MIGGGDWDMRTIHIEGNECLGCHRIGMKTVEEFMGDHWHPAHHMPPRDPGSLTEHFEELLACWRNGPENTPGCDWIIPPAGDCPSQVVGMTIPTSRGSIDRTRRNSSGPNVRRTPIRNLERST